MLSHLPLDIEVYAESRTKECSEDVVRAAWVAALNMSSIADPPPPFEHFNAISLDELAEAQCADEAISEMIKLKEAGTPLTDIRKAVSGATKRLFHEWGKLVFGKWSSVQARQWQKAVGTPCQVQRSWPEETPQWHGSCWHRKGPKSRQREILLAIHGKRDRGPHH